MLTGRPVLFELILTPNNFKGSIILLKSLLDKLLSPFILIQFFEFTNKPRISLASVPEFQHPIIFFYLF